MKKILLISLGVLLLTLCPSASLGQTAEEYRELGIKYWYKKDYTKAYNYFKKGSDMGDAQSALAIANMYKDGLRNGKEDYMLAAIYYSKAAERGEARGYFGYGWVYHIGGHSLTKDEQKAIAAFKKGAALGDPQSIEMLEELGIKTTTNTKTTTKTTTTTTKTTTKTTDGTKIKWLSAASTAQRKYRVRAGITSPSDVTNVIVKVNGQADRGIKTVKADGYDMGIDREVTLANGTNVVRIEITNGSGTYYSEKRVTCNTNSTSGDSDQSTNTKTTNTTERLKTNEKRVALVVGNANYQQSSMKLDNPVNDAADLAAKLVKLGFVVVRSLNQTQQGLESAIDLFSKKVKDADVALFFYAGHGIQYQGDNYLVPVDAKLPSEEYVKYHCTNANLVLDVMEKAGSKMKIVILDACRNNPFARSWHRSAGGGGLAIMNAPKGTFIAYSTAPGDVALDGGEGQRNSPYTAALLKTFDQKGLSITDFFQEVLERVATTTNERQTPWTSNSFRGKFVFNP